MHKSHKTTLLYHLLHLFTAHAKEALDLAKLQEQTSQLEYQAKFKVNIYWFTLQLSGYSIVTLIIIISSIIYGFLQVL